MRLPTLVRELAPDVLVAPVPEFAIRRPSVPTIAVIHDVSQIMAPRLYGWAKWLRFNLGHRHILATADAVVCVSHATLVGLRQS